MTRDVLKAIAKWVWVLAVLAFVSVYAHRHREAMLQAASMLGWATIAAAFLLVLSAKLGLVVNMRLAAQKFLIRLTWWDCYRIYNLTQLAKYIPGSIWQFVGRIAVLRERGVGAAKVRDSLLAEHLWVVLVASILGIALIVLSGGAHFVTWRAPIIGNRWYEGLVWGGGVVLVLCLVVAWLQRQRSMIFFDWLKSLVPPPATLIVLLFTWFFFGASLWVTLEPFAAVPTPLAYIVGVYCIAYVVGFFVPFAPAGLGVREALLVLALAPVVGNEVAVLLAGINRVVYFVAELVLAASCVLNAAND